jgi:hypothetical protein
MLDDSAKKMNKLNDNLTKTNTNLTYATEKMHKATTKRDTDVSKKKTRCQIWQQKQVRTKRSKRSCHMQRKNWSIQRRRLRISQGSSNKLISGHQWGDSDEHYCEKERIKLTAFEVETAISCQNKEKEDLRKTDAKRNNVNTIQLMGGRQGRHDETMATLYCSTQSSLSNKITNLHSFSGTALDLANIANRG